MQLSDEILQTIAHRFKAMSEPVRLKILHLLKEGELSVGEIADETGLKHGTASANLNALSQAGLVSTRREGTKIYYRLSSEMVIEICEIVCTSVRSEFEQMLK